MKAMGPRAVIFCFALLASAISASMAEPTDPTKDATAPAEVEAKVEVEAARVEKKQIDPEAVRKEVRELRDAFGDMEYDVREQAQNKLLARAADEAYLKVAVPLIAQHHAATSDVEVRARIEWFAEHYFQSHILPAIYKQPSFLGMSVRETMTEAGDRAIEVVGVLDETAASKAGFEAGDQILGLDGKKFELTYGVTDFTSDMRTRGVGAKVAFTVIRPLKSPDEIALTAKMGALPAAQMQDHEREALKEKSDELYQRWWTQSFLKGTVELPPEDAKAEAAKKREHRAKLDEQVGTAEPK